MSATGLAIIFIIIWWIVFFAILPIDVNRNKSVKIEGEDPGSPENPKMLKKFLYCTGITTIIFLIIYLLMKYEYLNLRDIESANALAFLKFISLLKYSISGSFIKFFSVWISLLPKLTSKSSLPEIDFTVDLIAVLKFSTISSLLNVLNLYIY